MDQPLAQSSAHPIRNLLVLTIAFALGVGCTFWFRFSNQALNYAFGFGVLFLPFLAFRPLLRLRGIPGVFGSILIAPLLILCLLIALMITCDFDPHPYSEGSCSQELQRIERTGYTVRLIRDQCGGVLHTTAVEVEQRMSLLPGLYFVRVIDYIDGDEGQITATGENQIHVHVPDGNGLPAGIDRTHTLKRHVYF